MTALRGSCLCGKVRFEIDGAVMQSSLYEHRPRISAEESFGP
jgi:hypothetical protein